MAESINGLYKAEVIHRKSWKNRTEVELATLTWVDWYNVSFRRTHIDAFFRRATGSAYD
ncbi:integrase core domain-containing protein, partial [Escherichia coli]|nr:integrase core domain-containing protein [Escherichia coli]